MTKNYFETIVGFIIIFVAVYFAFFSINNTGEKEKYGLNLNLKFDRVDGLSIGSDVKIAGLKVGTVSDANINQKTYQAEVIINLDDGLEIPSDSTAEIISAGLLGNKYIAIVPGGSEEFYENGDTINYTQSSISIESLIGKFMFNDDSEESSKDSKNTNTEPSVDDIFK